MTRREFAAAALAATSMVLGRGRSPSITSWFDPALADRIGQSAAIRFDEPLIIGPWTDPQHPERFAGDVDFGAAATQVEIAGGVRYFVMGGGAGTRNASARLEHGGRWRIASAWPPRAMLQPFYLQRAGVLSQTKAPEDFTWDEYRYDPRNPVPTIGAVRGAFDQRHNARPLSQRPDVLVFQTPPLEDDVEVVGEIGANLWVGTDGPATDFTVKLIDVYPPNRDYPNGFAMNLTDGITTVANRDSAPARVHEVRVLAPPTANRFVRGHRIRLDVSSSNEPRFPANPNTGGTGEPRVAMNRLYLDRARPSHVVLPVVRA